MRVVVTGASGFVGRHVVDELLAGGHTPILFVSPTAGSDDLNEEATRVDITDAKTLTKALEKAKPTACIHLAGIAFVPAGWTDPQRMFNVNLHGTLNLLEGLRHCAPTCRTLVVSSAEVYGRDTSEQPIHEETPLRPSNPYALSKMSADLMTLFYAQRYDLPLMTARPDNHIGPGQVSSFVISSLAKQLAAMAAGDAEPIIRVGNLASERNFTDVRDVARAYRLLIEKGSAGEAYNIASTEHVRIETTLNMLCDIAQVTPSIETDPSRFRPTDRTPIISTSKIHKATGWSPTYTLSQTIHDIYEDLQKNKAQMKRA